MDLNENSVQQKLPLIAIILVVANVVSYLLTELGGSIFDAEYMLQRGALYGPSFWEDHEYYRIVTHFFLHFGLEHLANNMLSLLVLGYALENHIGRAWFTILYMGAGVLAGGVSMMHSYRMESWQETISCGASGAIYGLMGALLVLLIVNRRKKFTSEIPRFLLYIGLSLYSGMQDPGIDNAAHVGGFLGGIVICIFMCVVKYMIFHRKGQVVS